MKKILFSVILIGISFFVMAGKASAADVYWFGDGGDWNDASHWSNNSGNSPASLHGSVPGVDDNVIFDANSFTVDDEIVYAPIEGTHATCLNLDSTGVTKNFTLHGGEDQWNHSYLEIYGDVLLGDKMTVAGNAWAEEFHFELYGDGIFSQNGATFEPEFWVWFLGGNQMLGSDLILETGVNIDAGSGSFNTNNYDIVAPVHFEVYSGDLYLGSSTIQTPEFYTESSDVFDAGTSTIIMEMDSDSYASFEAWDTTLYDIVFQNTLTAPDARFDFNGYDCNFHDITFLDPPYTVNIGTFSSWETITANNFIADGRDDSLFDIQGGGGILSIPSGTINLSYVSLSNSTATGGATFNAINSVDGGGNTGWNFLEVTNRYWVGDGGNWSDINHWSLSSDGMGGAAVPIAGDDVIFDENSITATGQKLLFDKAPTLLLNFEGEDGATTWTEEAQGLEPGFVADSNYLEIDTSQKKFGDSSLYFPSRIADIYGISGSFFYDLPNNSITSEATEDLWIRIGEFPSGSNVSNIFITTLGGDAPDGDYSIAWLYLGMKDGNLMMTATAYTNYPEENNLWTEEEANFLSLDTWYHIANVVDNNKVDFYIHDEDGNLIRHYTHTFSSPFDFTDSDGVGIQTHAHSSDGTSPSIWVDAFELVDYVKWTEDFTPPTSAPLVGASLSSLNMENLAFPITMNSIGENSPWNIVAPSGTIDVYNTTLINSRASGGATFNALLANNNVDGGGNSGWNYGPLTRYWIGDGGNWNDTDHWSNTSGGTGGVSVPVSLDTVIFDENSITANGQTILFGDIAYLAALDMENLLYPITMDKSDTVSYGDDVCIGGTASADASVSGYSPEDAFDDDSNTDWEGDGVPNWIKYDLGEGNEKISAQYTVQSYDADSYYISDWTFEGSNDDVNWDILDTQTGQVSADSVTYNNFSNSTAYRYYRWNITNGGADDPDVVEFEIMEAIPASDFWTLSVPSGTIDLFNTILSNSQALGGAIFNAFVSNGNVDGGGNSGWNFGATETYTVTFDTQGGSAVDPIVDTAYGDTIILPTEPTRDGYTFDGWFSDNTTFLIPFTEETEVTENIIVYAKWTANEDPINNEVDLAAPALTDITSITKDSVKLKVKISDYPNQQLDFVVKIRNEDKNNTKEKTFTKTTDEEGKANLTIEDLNSGTDYKFSVKFSEHGVDTFSDYSNSKKATTKDSIKDKECIPKNLRAQAVSHSRIKLTWQDKCSVEKGYKIERKTKGGVFEQIAKIAKNSESYQDEGLLPKATYTYRIESYNGNQSSDYSNNSTVTTQEQSLAATVIEEAPAISLPQSIISPELTEESQFQFANPPALKTEAIPKQPNQTIHEKLKETLIQNINKPIIQKTSTVVEIVGLITGMAAATAATAVPLFPLSPFSSSDIFSRFFSIFGLLGRSAKKKNEFGFVFDEETRRPIAGVNISILNEEGEIADSTITDSEGRYGFLAKNGTYTLQISKKGYVLKKDNNQDEFYGDLYTGSSLEIKENEMLKISIAMKALSINWRDFAKRKITAYTSIFSVIKKDAFIILFYVGFFAAIAMMYFFPTLFNGVIIFAYLTIAVYYTFFKIKSFGIISNESNKPVPFSMVSLYAENDTSRRITFTVSDVLGRYYLLVKDGFYNLKVQGQELNGNAFNKTVRVYAKKGIIREDVMVG